MKFLRRIGAFAVLLCLAVLLVAWGIDRHVAHSTESRIHTPDTLPDASYDCILVLGAGVRPDGSPSDMLRDRLSQALSLWQDGVSDVILVSGDHGSDDYDEVGTMKRYLTERGVPEACIVEDHAGFSTYDSLYRARDVFGVRTAVIVTQRYHLYRALYIADALELDACGVNSDPFTYRGQTMRDVREFVARCKDFFACILKPEPKYLGEPIALR